MTRRQFYVALLVLAVSGLLGGAVATWLSPATAAWAQQATTEQLRAQSFVLVDDEGRTRALLGFDDVPGSEPEIDPGPQPGLWLFDEHDRARLAIRLDPITADPRVALWDASGEPRAVLSLIADEPAIYLWDERGQLAWRAP